MHSKSSLADFREWNPRCYFRGAILTVVGMLPDSQDVLPASRISAIVGASSLTDEEIQWLIGQLLEKSKANSEWEAVSRPTMSFLKLSKLSYLCAVCHCELDISPFVTMPSLLDPPVMLLQLPSLMPFPYLWTKYYAKLHTFLLSPSPT